MSYRNRLFTWCNITSCHKKHHTENQGLEKEETGVLADFKFDKTTDNDLANTPVILKWV